MIMRFRPIALLSITAMLLGTIISGCAATPPAVATAKSGEARIVPGREPIVLVCPIDCMSDAEEVCSVGTALAPLIRRDLFCAQQISVIPTEDTHVQGKSFFLKEAALERLGQQHGADVVTVGFISAGPQKLRIEFHAYDCKSGSFLLKTSVEDKGPRSFDLERKLVYELIDAIGVTLSKEERERLASNKPKKIQAALDFGSGLRYEHKGSRTEALMAYESAISTDKNVMAPYAAAARIYAEYNALAKAMDMYLRAVEADPYFAEAWYQLNLYAERYNKDEKTALEYCRKALDIAPRFGKARLSLGARLYALGDLNGAIEETKKAAPLLSVDPLPCHNLGVYYRDAGQPAEARRWFEQALERSPGFSPARAELKKLGQEKK